MQDRHAERWGPIRRKRLWRMASRVPTMSPPDGRGVQPTGSQDRARANADRDNVAARASAGT
eukprot:8382727-Pyramimonas_sp.AAC.1